MSFSNEVRPTLSFICEYLCTKYDYLEIKCTNRKGLQCMWIPSRTYNQDDLFVFVVVFVVVIVFVYEVFIYANHLID